VASHFSLAGTLRLHRAALGWDIARAPLNLAVATPRAGVLLAAAGARRLGAKRLAGTLGSRCLIQRTAVAREVAWLVQTELLELPARDGTREAKRAALAETIVADPRLIIAMRPMIAAIEASGTDPALRACIEAAVANYAGTRVAAAEITTALLSLGTGAAALSKLTPGAARLKGRRGRPMRRLVARSGDGRPEGCRDRGTARGLASAALARHSWTCTCTRAGAVAMLATRHGTTGRPITVGRTGRRGVATLFRPKMPTSHRRSRGGTRARSRR
jgi:hypothetical protein